MDRIDRPLDRIDRIDRIKVNSVRLKRNVKSVRLKRKAKSVRLKLTWVYAKEFMDFNDTAESVRLKRVQRHHEKR